MAETTGIQSNTSIEPMGANAGKSVYYGYKGQTVPKKIISGVKIGDIVFGKVLKVLNEGLAQVRLPMGDFTAQLHNKLKSGDSLFFLVEKLEPKLFLKIYGINSAINGARLATDEILRVLDFPNKELYSQIVNYLSKTNSTIKREDILSFLKLLGKISNNADNYPIESRLEYINFLINTNLIDNEPKDLQLLPSFLSPSFIRNLIDKLPQLESELPPVLAQKLKDIIARISKTPSFPIKNIFSMHSHETTLYEVLTEISQSDSFSKLSEGYKESIVTLLSLITSLELLNHLSGINQIPIVIFFAYILHGKFGLAKLSTKRHSQKKSKKDMIEFELSAHWENLGEVRASGKLYGTILSIKITVQNQAIRNAIESEIKELAGKFIDMGFSINSLKVETLEESHSIGSTSITSTKTISVVI